jgi:hypothetical protein
MLYSGGGGIVSAEATRQRRNPDRQQIVTPLSVTPVPRTTGAASSSRSNTREDTSELYDLASAIKMSHFDSLVGRPVGASSSIHPVSNTRELDELALAMQLSRLEAENSKKFEEDTALALQKSLTTAKPVDKQQQLVRRRLERERERHDRGGPSNNREAGIRRSRKMRKSKRRITRRKRIIKSKRKTRRRH